MADGVIRIVIDSSGSTRGARKVKSDLETIREAFNRNTTATKKSTVAFGSFAKTLIGAASVGTALVFVTRQFRAVREAGEKFTKTVSELSAITGATGEGLRELADAARDIGRETTLGASAAAEGFKLIASAKPDLLENRDALIAVTKEAVTLSEAAGLTLPDAARALGGALNQFKLDAEDAGRVINVLAAGSQKGATEIPDLTESLRLSGAAASALGLSFEQTIAGIEALGEVNIKGSEAGSNFRNVLLALKQTGVDALDPSIHGLAGALRNMNELSLDSNQILKIFGRENFTAATALAERTDRLEQLEQSITDTNTAEEQARTNTNNLTADQQKLDNAMEDLYLTIFERLEPSLREGTQSLVGFLNAFSRGIGVLGDFGDALGDAIGTDASKIRALSAASVAFIDKRIEEETQVLFDLKEQQDSLSGQFIQGLKQSASFGLADTLQEDIEDQAALVQELLALRGERAKLTGSDAPAGGRTAPPKKTTKRLSQAEIDEAKAQLLTGKGGGTKQTAEEKAAERAIKEQARAFAALRAELQPLQQAQDDFANSKGVLLQQMNLEKISQAELEDLLGKLEDSYRDVLDPVGALNRSLEEERAAIGKTTEALEIDQRVRDAAEQLKAAGVENSMEVAEGFRAEFQELQRLNEQHEKRVALLEEIKGPARDQADQLNTLKDLFADNEISADQFNKKLIDLRLQTLDGEQTVEAGFERGFIRASQNLQDFATLAEQTVTGAFQGMEDGIVNFAKTGEISIESLRGGLEGLLSDLVRIQARQALLSLFGSPATQGNSGSGLFGLFGAQQDNTSGASGFAGLAGGLASAFASSGGGGFGDGGIQNTPTISPLAEKGPEAIIPLKGGNVPVKIQSDPRPQPVVTNTFNISTPDVAGFNSSQDQIALMAAQAFQEAMARNG